MKLTWERHQALHAVFGNRTIEEIIDLMLHWYKYRAEIHHEADKAVAYEHFTKRFNELR